MIFLFTDGEERGLLGAQAWFAARPPPIGAVLNMEARGGGGRALMFETGPGNGAMIELFARTAPLPSSNSLAVFIYERMPNGTDFTVARRRGLQGMNFAFIGRPGQYHQPGSTPEALDQGSLQHMGDQCWPRRALAQSRRCPQAAPTRPIPNLLVLVLLRHPTAVGWVAPALARRCWPSPAGGARRGLLPAPDRPAPRRRSAFYLLLRAFTLLRLAARLAGRLEPQAVLYRFMVYEARLPDLLLPRC